MTPLFETTPQVVMSGLTPSLPLPLRPLWSAGSGIVFSDASVQNFPARTQLLALSEQPLDLIQAFVDATPRLYVGTTKRLLRYTPSAGMTSMNLGNFGAWQLLAWGDWLIASDGINPVLVVKGETSPVPLAGVTFTWARLIEKYANYVFVANTSNGVTRVEWCQLDNPEEWTPTVDNTAGFYDIRDMDSGIKSTAALGPAQALYSGDSMFTMRYVTDRDIVMSITPAVSGLGGVSRRSVVSDGRLNWGLMQRGVFKTDGVSKAFVDEPRVRKLLRETTDWDAAEQIYGSLDEARHMIQWHLPQTAGGFKTIAYDYDGDAWTFPHENVFVGLEEGAFNSLLLGTETAIETVGAGSPAASYVQTRPLDCGSRDAHKMFQELWLDIEADVGVVVKVGYCRDSIYETPELTETYAAAERIPLQFGGSSAIAIVLRIEAAAGLSWRLSGLRLMGTASGNVS